MKQSWEQLNLPVSEQIFNYPIEIQECVFAYLTQMNEKEKKAYVIAKDHLGTSFNIIKSTGYINWKKKN